MVTNVEIDTAMSVFGFHYFFSCETIEHLVRNEQKTNRYDSGNSSQRFPNGKLSRSSIRNEQYSLYILFKE